MFETKRFDEPDERTEFPHGRADTVRLGDRKIVRVTYEPGFRWTNDLAPKFEAEVCPIHYRILMLSGRLGLRLVDGDEREIGPGEAADVAPGHDSWTVGDEPAVFLDFDPETPKETT